MAKIKVLHILHSFGIGGMEKGISMLVQNASDDFEHIIMCMERSGASEKLLPAGTRVVALGKGQGSSFRFIVALARAIRKEKPDVVHTRNWGGMDAIIAARLAGVKNVVHGEHGWGMDDPLGASKKRRLIRRILSLGVCEFTVVSKQIAHWMKEDVKVLRPVQQIYNGVDLSTYHCCSVNKNLRRELALPDSSLLIGVVGRLDPIKDHAGLIDAFKCVREKLPESHLVIVGDGPERRRLESLAGDAVYFLGIRSDIPEILNSLDVFSLASLNEGISNTLLEAMACGLPIVATAVGGTPELIESGRNGLLVSPGDSMALAEGLIEYLSDPVKRLNHGSVNRCNIEKNFTIQAMVSDYEVVWRRVASS